MREAACQILYRSISMVLLPIVCSFRGAGPHAWPPRPERKLSLARERDLFLIHIPIMTVSSGSVSPTLAAAPLSTGSAKDLTTSNGLHAHLAALTARESQLTAALNDLVSNRDTLDDAIDRLRSLVPRIKDLSVEVDGRPAQPGSATPFASWPHADLPDRLALEGAMGEEGLADRVSRVWETSERVGGKVRKLDTEVSRVKQAADRVTAVLELKVGRARVQGFALCTYLQFCRTRCKPYARPSQSKTGSSLHDAASERWISNMTC